MPSPPLQTALQTLTIVGVVLSLTGIVLTVFTLLYFKLVHSEFNTITHTPCVPCHTLCVIYYFHYLCKILLLTLPLCRNLRKRVLTIFHIQLCTALFCLLIIFVCGINRTAVYGGCVAVSALIHYLTLVSVMFMGAVAVLMFKKLVIVFGSTSAKFLVTLSLICWRKCVTAAHLHIITVGNIMVDISNRKEWKVWKCTDLYSFFCHQWYQSFLW